MSDSKISSGVIVGANQNRTVSSGEIYSNTIVSCGYLNIMAGGIAKGSPVSSAVVRGSSTASRGSFGNVNVYSSGSVDTMTVDAFGRIIVSGGAVDNILIKKNGYMILSSGGTAENTVLSGGINNSNISRFADYQFTVKNGAAAVQTTVARDGSFGVESGGTASDTIISSGGKAIVTSGGVMQNTVVSSGGSQILSGGIAEITILSSGGMQIVSANGCASAAAISSGGIQTVLNGGTTSDFRVENGGRVTVSSGGTVSGIGNVVLSGGSTVLSSGAILSGEITAMGEIFLEEGVDLSSNNAGIYLWVDKENSASIAGNAMLHSFSALGEYTGKCFISVPGDVADNTYTIADGAGEFSGTLGVYNDDWINSQVDITVGETISSNGIIYTLNNNDGKLCVSIINETIYSRRIENWVFSGDNTIATSTFSVKYAGRYKLGNFTEADNFSGTVTIQDASGNIVTSFTVRKGEVIRNMDILLDPGEYKVVCNSVYANAISDKSWSNIQSSDIFYRANTFEDDYWNQLSADAPVTVLAVEEGKRNITATISDPEDFYEFVGYSDLQDWRKIEVTSPGAYSIAISKNDDEYSAIKVSLYRFNGVSIDEVVSAEMGDSVKEFKLTDEYSLENGTYYMKVESVYGSEGYGATYGAVISGRAYDLHNDNSWNDLPDSETRIYTADRAVDGVITNCEIVAFGEYISYGDTDWRQINIAASGVYSISVNKEKNYGSAMKAVLYSVNGTALKKITSVTVSDSTDVAMLIKDKQLSAGTYYIQLDSNAGKNSAGATYGVSLSGKEYVCADRADTAALTAVSVLNGTAGGEVNFANPELYFRWEVESAGLYSLTLSPDVKNSVGSNALSLTVYSAPDGKTALSKVTAFNTKHDSSGSSKEIFLDSGVYYVSVKSAQTAKGADVTFTLQSNGTAYPVDSTNAGNFLEAETVVLNDRTALVNEYAGFGAPVEFIKLNHSGNAGKYSFTLANSGNGNASVTIWQWSNGKLVKVKSVSAAAGKSGIILKDVKLVPDGEYYLQIDGSAAAKSNKYAAVSINVSAFTPDESAPVPEYYSGSADFAAAETLAVSQKKNNTLFQNFIAGGSGDISWFNFDFDGEVPYGGIFSFTVSNTGTGSATFGIYQLSADGNSVKKIKSVSVAAGKTVSFDSIAMTAQGEYFVQIDGSAAAKKGTYADISVSATADHYNKTGNFSETVSGDDMIWMLDDVYKFNISCVGDVTLSEDIRLDSSNTTDFRMVTLENSGFFNFTLSSAQRNADLTATLYKWNDAGSALVKVANVVLNTKNPILEISLNKDIFLTAGEYFIGVSCSNTGNGGMGDYSLEFNAPIIFDDLDMLNSDDNIDGAVMLDGSSRFLGGTDTVDYFKWVTDAAGYYNFTLSSGELNAKLSATLYKWNANGTALVKAGSVDLSASGGSAAMNKDLLLDQGEYFIAVTCANTAKGGYAKYTIETGASVIFNHSDLNNSDDSLAGARRLEISGDSGSIELISDGGGYVGYQDSVDFIKLDAVRDGEYIFNVKTTNDLKFTIYRYDTVSGKLTAVAKTATFASDGALAPVYLNSGNEYYIALEAKNSKEETVYSLNAELRAAVDVDAGENEVSELKRGESALFAFDVSAENAGWEYLFGTSGSGTLELFKYDEKKGALSAVKMVNDRELSLAAGSYCLVLEAAQDIAGSSVLNYDPDERSFTWSAVAE